MSIARGWAALNLEMPPEIPRTEYISNYAYLNQITGMDVHDPAQAEEAWRQAYRIMDYDFLWLTINHGVGEGRNTWMGTATFAENQQNLRPHIEGFETVQDVLDVDPLTEYRLPSLEERVKLNQEALDNSRRGCPDAIIPGGIYNTVFTWCILAFGWEKFMEAALADPVRFDEIMEGFTTISMRDVEAWMQTDCEFFLCHDDIVWTQGPVFHPDWYRKYVLPRYERLWAPLKAKGMKVIFCSDGCYNALIDDIAAVGADGFIFEPCVNLDYVVEKYGQTHVIVGNMDCRVLMFGSRADITAEVERCYHLGKNCPGYFYAIGNHIPYNVPLEAIQFYMDEVARLRKR